MGEESIQQRIISKAPHPSPLPQGEDFDELSRAEIRPPRGERLLP